MGSIDYKKLYLLQDEVLKVVFATEHEFYLTGGSCLSRFYVEKRYSDDLDFFTKFLICSIINYFPVSICNCSNSANAGFCCDVNAPIISILYKHF